MVRIVEAGSRRRARRSEIHWIVSTIDVPFRSAFIAFHE
jgi:hypothetical protein